MNIDHLPSNFKSIVDEINKGYKICVILRGLPGSGKSFLSDQLIRQTVKENQHDHILSADKYFFNNRGIYRFDPSRLSEAHQETQKMFTRKAAQGISPLIVDNTNLQYWEMEPYMLVANQYGYIIYTMEPETPWKFQVDTLAKKNQHSVPNDKIRTMRVRYETGYTVDQHLMALGRKSIKDPQLRSHPPILKPYEDLIDFNEDISKLKLIDAKVKDNDSAKSSNFQWNLPNQISQEESWNEMNPTPNKMQKETVKKNPFGQSHKKQQRKTKIQDDGFLPHKKDCENENSSFRVVRELYSTVNDAYLWDFFVKCKGDADWCVNLLCDENMTDQMDSGDILTCDCEEKENVDESGWDFEDEKPQQQSPSVKAKKLKIKSEEELIEAKNAIEMKLFNYDDKMSEKDYFSLNGIQSINEEEFTRFPITKQMVLDLDEEFGGGSMKGFIESQQKLPAKVFLKKTTAMQIYLELMECIYSHDEEKKLEREKSDEEFAIRLHSQEQRKKLTKLDIFTSEKANEWKEGESTGDIALRMSKEKLIQLFPSINKDDLLAIFSGTNNNFKETVDIIEDSLVCNSDERKAIEDRMKNIFNSPWPELEPKSSTSCPSTPIKEFKERDLEKDKKRVEELRQEIADSIDEQKVLQQKVADSIRRKQFNVAGHYQNMAALKRLNREEADHEVANLMVAIHASTQKSDTTIDLHYLKLAEANQVLQNFFDRNINRLRATGKPYEDLYVITGQGKNSMNGISAIKNSAKTICKYRNFK